MDHASVRLIVQHMDDPIDLWVPLDITVRELWTAINTAYHLSDDQNCAYLQAENPIMFLKADHDTLLADVGVRCGTRLYYTNRAPVR